MNIQLSKMYPHILLAYLQFLKFSDLSSSAIANQLSAIKANFSVYGLSTHLFTDSHIKFFQKAMVLHRPFKVHLRKLIDIPTLQIFV